MLQTKIKSPFSAFRLTCLFFFTFFFFGQSPPGGGFLLVGRGGAGGGGGAARLSRRPPGLCIIIFFKGLSVNRVMLPRPPVLHQKARPLVRLVLVVVVKIEIFKVGAALDVLLRLHKLKIIERAPAAKKCHDKGKAQARPHCLSLWAAPAVPRFPALLPCRCKRSCCPCRRGSSHLPFRLRIFRVATANGGRGCFGASVLHKC